MKFKLALFFTLLMLTLNSSLSAQNSTEGIINEFFATYEKSPLEGIDFIFQTNKWMIKNNREGIGNVKTQLSNILNQIGDYQGYEQLSVKNVSENYKVINYMVRYDRQPLRFIFIFYKPNNTWQIQNFQFNDNFEDLVL